MLPTLRQLEYLVAVADHLNFGRAADACGVSQPGLSAQLRELEDQLGTRLFERARRRGVVTTDAGLEIVARAREVLVSTRELVESARAFAEPFAGELRLGVIPTIAPYTLPLALPALRSLYPDLKIALYEGHTATLVEKLGDAQLDLALLAAEADLGSLEVVDLYEDSFLLCLPDSHELAGRPTVCEADLADLPLLLLEEGHCLRDQALSFCSSRGAKEAEEFRATSLTTLVQMVASGFGATLLPAMATAAGSHALGNVRCIPFDDPQPARTISMAWRPTTARRTTLDGVAAQFRLMRPGAIVGEMS